jgi:hypothetical protein
MDGTNGPKETTRVTVQTASTSQPGRGLNAC